MTGWLYGCFETQSPHCPSGRGWCSLLGLTYFEGSFVGLTLPPILGQHMAWVFLFVKRVGFISGSLLVLYELGPCLGHYPPHNQTQNQTHPQGQETHQKPCIPLVWPVSNFFLLLGTNQGGWALKTRLMGE